MAPGKVRSACVRCRRQKLKCDSERPCTMCSRSGVQCVASQTLQWRPYWSSSGPGRRRQMTIGQEETPVATTGSRHAGSTSEDESSTNMRVDPPVETPWTDSSSTIMLLEEAFHHHHATSPGTSETSALGYGQAPRKLLANAGRKESDQVLPVSDATPPAGLLRISRAAAQELLSLLPTIDVAGILVEIYFDKVHWFMLLFHQLEFRNDISELYNNGASTFDSGVQASSKGMGFVSAFLAVCAISLRLVGDDQRRELIDHGIEPDILRERILATLRLRLLEIIALGSLEAVQMCVLLGSYYLYHGEPELAWPLCGCALRLGQALELHRSSQTDTAAPSSASGSSPHNVETKKRCWWAIHEIETFCSMIYGFPQSISDADCDVSALDPNDPWSLAADAQPSSPGQPTLLEYKCSMLKLSKIIKSTLSVLYGTRRQSPRSPGQGPSRVRDLITKVAALDTQLAKWHTDLPDKLKLGDLAEFTGENTRTAEQTSDTPAQSFNEQLFQLQALALKLAFENTRILIHRPLLSYRATHSLVPTDGLAVHPPPDPFSHSIQACRHAALQISWASRAGIFNTASTTYALSFVSLHLLTAGVTLCIMTSLDPLSRQAHEWKLGIRRLMTMLMALKTRTILADQGLELLKKLLRLVMQKETERMLCVGPMMPQVDLDVPPHTTQGKELPSTCDILRNSCQEEPDTDLTTSLAADLTMPFDFYEDHSMTQVLQNVEHVMSYNHYTDPASTDPVEVNFPSFIGQDQGWIWGSTFDFGSDN